MNFLQSGQKHIALVAFLTLALPIIANARTWGDGDRDHRHMRPVSAEMSHHEHCDEDGGMYPMARGLDLSESQRDKIFAIKYAQGQALYDQDKIVRNAYIDLHKMATSDQYVDDKAEAISDSLAKARAKIALIRAREEHQIYALLTDEQRRLLSSRQAEQSRGKPDFPLIPGNRM
ncbi:MAG TPA: Spy/CpxP family protein refolding chaperone [Gallionella sp.]|nr:Spy/CpxP family protein refolding chaperone [Gallionella sp.]